MGISDGFQTNIKEAEAVIKKQQEFNQTVVENVEKLSTGNLGAGLDIEQATLSDIQNQEKAMQSNVANLIVNLDKITNSFGSSFNEMKEHTMSEKFVGFFSKNKSTAMREDRIKGSDIESQLQELISESNMLLTMLQQQAEVLMDQKTKIQNGLKDALEQRISVTKELADTEGAIAKLDIPIMDVEERISTETEASNRSVLEKEKQELINQQNELIKNQDVLVAKAQSYEKYVKMYQTYADSLENQIATQKVLINKLRTDTDNRIILYEATAKSLVTAQQQDTAHKLNDIGMAVDSETTATMALIGAAANTAVAKMFEEHSAHMKTQGEIQEAKKRADEVFFRRMNNVLEAHNKGEYK